MLAALSASGLPSDRFFYRGFLAAKSAARKRYFESIREAEHTEIVFESNHRILKFLNDFLEVLGTDRVICVARELTKLHETIVTGPAGEVADTIRSRSQKGEFVVVIEGAADTADSNVDIDRLLVALADWFEWLRWAGVAYLLYAGWQQWRAPAPDLNAPAAKLPLGRMLRRGLAVSIANPKTLLFYAAFLPQFVDPAGNIGAQLAILAGTGFVLALVVDGGWALLAGWLRPALIRFGRLANRVTGGLLIGAGLGLALARRS